MWFHLYLFYIKITDKAFKVKLRVILFRNIKSISLKSSIRIAKAFNKNTT